MVVDTSAVKTSPVDPGQLDLGYLALFFGQRVNELVKERGAAAGFRGLRDSHGYVIQHLIDADRSMTELARRMEVTQQAASKVAAELIKLGAIEIVPTEDRRERRVRLSKRGWEAVRLGRKHRRQIEARLLRALGAERHAATKEALVRCLQLLGGLERIRSRRIRQPL